MGGGHSLNLVVNHVSNGQGPANDDDDDDDNDNMV